MAAVAAGSQVEVCDLPLTSTQLGLLGLLELEPSTTAYHMPVLMELDAILDVVRLQGVLDIVARRHEALRSVVAGHHPDLHQRVSRRGTVTLERVAVAPGDGPGRRTHRVRARPFRPAHRAAGPGRLQRLG